MKSLATVTLCILLCSLTSGRPQPLTETQVSDLSSNACVDFRCGNISYDEMLKWYGGLLLTVEEIKQLEINRERRRVIDLEAQGYKAPVLARNIGDGDACCATDIVHMMNHTMLNVYGERKSIVHMPDSEPPRYQYIPHGLCVEYGECIGTCLVESTLLTLLIVDGDSLTFDFFLVPGYCSCKNFRRS